MIRLVVIKQHFRKSPSTLHGQKCMSDIIVLIDVICVTHIVFHVQEAGDFE